MRTWKPDRTSRRTTPRPAGWKAIRERILTRDGHRCTWLDNGHRCTAQATDVDHIADPADHSDTNLRSLCGPHHDKRTAAQANAARWSKPTARRHRPAPRHPGLK